VNIAGDQHHARLSRRLDARGDVWHLAIKLGVLAEHHGPGMDADPNGQCDVPLAPQTIVESSQLIDDADSTVNSASRIN